MAFFSWSTFPFATSLESVTRYSYNLLLLASGAVEIINYYQPGNIKTEKRTIHLVIYNQPETGS